MIGICGSRQLRDSSAIKPVVESLLQAGHSLAVGCAIGADQLALSAALQARQGKRVAVFAVGGADGEGFWRDSAKITVRRAVTAGVQVHWWAGGHGELVSRLKARTQAMVKAIDASRGKEKIALIAFLGSTQSHGTVGTMQLAASLNIPVIAFPGPGVTLPSLGWGSWEPAGQGVWAQARKWVARPKRVQL